MSSFDFVYGGFKQKESSRDFDKETLLLDSEPSLQNHLTTYYANANIYSLRSPREYPPNPSPLYKNVFDD